MGKVEFDKLNNMRVVRFNKELEAHGVFFFDIPLLRDIDVDLSIGALTIKYIIGHIIRLTVYPCDVFLCVLKRGFARHYPDPAGQLTVIEVQLRESFTCGLLMSNPYRDHDGCDKRYPKCKRKQNEPSHQLATSVKLFLVEVRLFLGSLDDQANFQSNR